MKITEKLATAPTNRVVHITPHITYDTSVISPSSADGVGRVIRTELRFTMEQTASEVEVRESRGQVVDFMHDRAKRAMLHELYGEVENELRTIQTMIWEASQPYDQEIVRRIGNLIGELH